MAHSQLMRANQASLHYTRSLAAAYRRFIRIWEPDFASASDLEAWQKLRRDPVLAHAIEKRSRAVAGVEWRVVQADETPASERAAQLVHGLLEKIARFSQARRTIAEESIFRGSSFHFIEGEPRLCRVADDRARRWWWVPTGLAHVDRWRFQIRRLGTDEGAATDEIRTRWELFSVGRQRWEPLEHPEFFVKSVFDAREETLGYGRGLLQSLFYFWRAKEIVLAQLLTAIERWVQGFVEVGIDDERMGSESRTNDQIQDDYIEQINKHRSEHVFVHAKRDEVKIHDAPRSGYDMALEAMNYLDRGCVQLILTSVLPTGGGGEVGSFARAETEAAEMEATFQVDREAIAEDLTADLVGFVWRRNLPTIRALLREEGVAGDPLMPRFEILQQSKEDHEVNARVAIQLLEKGIDLVAEEIYRRTGWTQPREGDPVVEGQRVPAPGSIPFSDTSNRLWGRYAECQPGERADLTGCTPKGRNGNGKAAAGRKETETAEEASENLKRIAPALHRRIGAALKRHAAAFAGKGKAVFDATARKLEAEGFPPRVAKGIAALSTAMTVAPVPGITFAALTVAAGPAAAAASMLPVASFIPGIIDGFLVVGTAKYGARATRAAKAAFARFGERMRGRKREAVAAE